MKAIEYATKTEDFNLGYTLRNERIAGFLAAKHEEEINKFNELCPDKELVISNAGIELSWATREQLVAFLTSFGGEWKKDAEEYYPDKMRYFQEKEIGKHKYTIKAGCVPPPPSCKIVEEEVIVPEHKEKKKKIVCKEPNKTPLEELQQEKEAQVETHS